MAIGILAILQEIAIIFYFVLISKQEIFYRWAGSFVPPAVGILCYSWISYFTANSVLSSYLGYTVFTLLQFGFLFFPRIRERTERGRNYCPECGSGVRTGWKVCPACGFELWQVLEKPEVEIEVLKGKKKEKVTEEVPIPPSTVHLVVKEGADRGKIYLLNRDVVNIGRDSSNDIALTDPFISGKHCRIRREDEQYTLVDLGSSNGTRVNGREIQRTVLQDGDIIEIGSTRLHLVWKK